MRDNMVYPIEKQLIHEKFFEIAKKQPELIAVAWEDEKGESCYATYGEVAKKAHQYRSYLKKLQVKTGDIVGVSLDKGSEYISAIMGVLAAGAIYLPMSFSVPENRKKFICKKAEIQYVICSAENQGLFQEANLTTILPSMVVEECVCNCCENSEDIQYKKVPYDNDAYIIFTSGTTGEPKGVEISHAGAWNTIADINERFEVTQQDTCFGVSEIDFDLSVYDVFGLLSTGGKIVICDRSMKKEASKWKQRMLKEHVTVWNSVPMLLEMLISADDKNEVIKNLRLILVSGDWVYPSLVNKIRDKNPDVRIVALGGATEASIWSNFYEVEGRISEDWKSVPYGKALHNQALRVVDENGKECAPNQEGEIQIGGDGVARGYINMPELTAEKFILDEEGNRWYRTGDKGMYWEDGNIEFLGRLDNQVKFGGYRIELDEIIRTTNKYEPVQNSFTVLIKNNAKQFIASAVTLKKSGKKGNVTLLEEVNDNHQMIVKQQSIVSNYTIMKLLRLDEYIESGLSVDALFEQLEFSKDNINTYNYWIQLLAKNQCIAIKDQVISKGEAFDSFMAVNQEDEMIHAFSEKYDFLTDIMKGKKNSFEMFEDDFLSPEGMAKQEEGIKHGVTRIAEELKKQYDEEELMIRIAILGARGGIIAKMLLEQIDEVDSKVTLVDTSSYELKKAREVLADYDCDCQVVGEYVPSELRNSFDVVIAINTLHTYNDLSQGVFLVNDLMKAKGKAFILELKMLPPMSNITTALIEDGFSRYTVENRPFEHNPTTTTEHWLEILTQADFAEISHCSMENSLFEYFAVSGKNTGNDVSEHAIKYFLSKQLPEYMIPEKIIFLDSIPLNKNGKANAKKLIELLSVEEQTDLILPRTETEIKLAELWKTILGVKQVGINQSFFKAGGDSLLATHLLVAVREEFNVELSMKEMYQEPTLESIAETIDNRKLSSNEEEIECGEI